jgi:hypothetical protein
MRSRLDATKSSPVFALSFFSNWMRCFRRELRLEVSAITCKLAFGGWSDRFGFFEVADPIGNGSDRRSLTGWISIGVEVRFLGNPHTPEISEWNAWSSIRFPDAL